MMEDNYEKFKEDVFKLTKIDLNAYKEKQMKRRIDTLISKRDRKSTRLNSSHPSRSRMPSSA